MNIPREVLRRKLLEEMYDKLSPEDKRLFVQLTMQDKSRDEILQTLQQQNDHFREVTKIVSSHRSWFSDLSSNIAGNAVWDGLVYLASRLIKKL